MTDTELSRCSVLSRYVPFVRIIIRRWRGGSEAGGGESNQAPANE